jgi:hypothetical protein
MAHYSRMTGLTGSYRRATHRRLNGDPHRKLAPEVCPEVGFGDIAMDVLQARFRVADNPPTILDQAVGIVPPSMM